MIRRPPRSTLFPTRRSSDLHWRGGGPDVRGGWGSRHVQLRKIQDAVGTAGQRNGEKELCGHPLQSFPHWGSEEHTAELQAQSNLRCRLLLEKKKPHEDVQRR